MNQFCSGDAHINLCCTIVYSDFYNIIYNYLNFEPFDSVPPEIEPKSSSHVKGIVGESVTLECFVKGDPTPQVSWIKDGVTLPR